MQIHHLNRAIRAALIYLLCTGTVSAQSPLLFKWWIELSDKKDSPYSIDRPAEFLSARSLERRAVNGCPVKYEDLPVNSAYVQAIRQSGIAIHGTSRWMNAVAIIADSSAALRLRSLPFVKNIERVGRDIRFKNPPNRPDKKRIPFAGVQSMADKFGEMGYGLVNSGPLRTPFLYQLGARGKGIWVAVMDGGFTNTDTIPLFDSIALNQRLWPGPDFVEHDRAVYESAQHGTSVLSVMAANIPGYFVGAATEATYFLLKTEDTGGEFPIEEVNWILGAEWADSIGVDIINASLGYTTFSDPAYNRPYSALDGRSSIGARGASIAAQKGMVICNSAGNSGAEPWKYMGVPADAPGIIAVGATDSQDGKRAPFSSFGPTADGRIKPDLSAPGQNVVTAGNVGDDLTMSAGTSIASPILAGSIAALWSAFPGLPARTLLDTLFATASQMDKPDNRLGYGVPDMAEAWLRLKKIHAADKGIWWGGYQATGQLQGLLLDGQFAAPPAFVVKNVLGQTCLQGTASITSNKLQTVTVEGMDILPPGCYFLEIGGVREVLGWW